MQVDKHGDDEHHYQHHCIGFRDFEQVFEASEVDDAPADGDKDAGQNRQGHIFHQAAQTEEDGQQEECVNHTADLGASAAFHVDHSTHGGAGAGQTAEETRHSVADALSDELFIAVVFGFGDIVGHHRGEQSVDRAETSQSETGNE